MDDGDAYARHLVGGHAVLERSTSVRVVPLHHRRSEARSNALDVTLNIGREHSLSHGLLWLKEECGGTQQCGQQA
jgi:hypothetical protein